ncbi:MAG: chromate resistance protein [Methylibium sp.]|uniref:chromate resistance protein ChrB domain-containing protein n=1 Tax=Methylibium sp. TaxID=2067992 RepID=UPI0017C71393|nr:chromate resistance protein ChrB domain-containing protein [Methylibium sp.]MBA3597053.1 chromate resistance protein [Methylibium sp.]
MSSPPAAWLLLILSLPTQGATARMRIWRSLKAQGCAALRDGAYLLPASAEHQAALRDLADECLREGGSAWVMAATPTTSAEAEAYPVLFDRSEDYAGLVSTWKEAGKTLASLGAAELARLQKKLRRDYDALRAIDFFPNEASVEAEAAWGEFTQRLARFLSPDEPQGSDGEVPRLDPGDYQGRLWATRRRLWVDRVASAWLIRRFIDRDARFEWLAKPSDCPRKALGFDFDGARFTHVGERVSFEVLMASFGLDDDAALVRLGALVHVLDVGGEPVPEAGGFEAVLAGARERVADDDALLAEMSAVLDSLYVHFQREGQRTKLKGAAR